MHQWLVVVYKLSQVDFSKTVAICHPWFQGNHPCPLWNNPMLRWWNDCRCAGRVETWMRQTDAHTGKQWTPSRNDELVLEDQANSTKSSVTSLKVGRNTSCGPMKASFLCGVQVIQQVQDQGLQGIGGLKEVFHGATSNYFFRYENFRKQKQDKLRIYLQDSCQ